MSDLKVACATHFMAHYYSKYFPNMTVVGHEKGYNPKGIDLLILTGGEDVNPARYKEAPGGAYSWNDERDEREFNILRTTLDHSNTKVLGVCRGFQLMNVFCGGSLFQDIDSDGKSHPGIHNVEYVIEDYPLSWLTRVNSLHHQALKTIGDDYWDYHLVSFEPETDIIESVSWRDRMFGTQFHPELFKGDMGDKFFSIISKWVKGETSLDASNYESSDNEPDFDEDDDTAPDGPTIQQIVANGVATHGTVEVAWQAPSIHLHTLAQDTQEPNDNGGE